MNNPTSDPFPDELLDVILAKTDEIFTKTPVTEFKGITQEQLHTSILNTANVMIIGAKLALDYINEKNNNHG